MNDSGSQNSAADVPQASVVSRPDSKFPESSETAIFTRILDLCVHELMDAYGFEAVVTDYVPERMGNTPCLAAFIGFGGDAVRGALTAVAPRSFLEETHPMKRKVKELTDSDAGDWCCEFVNQLLGRMKNKSVRRNLAFQVSTPQSIISDRLRIVRPARGGLIVRNYRVKRFELLVCLDVMLVGRDVLLGEDTEAAAEVPAEGELLLF